MTSLPLANPISVAVFIVMKYRAAMTNCNCVGKFAVNVSSNSLSKADV